VYRAAAAAAATRAIRVGLTVRVTDRRLGRFAGRPEGGVAFVRASWAKLIQNARGKKM